MGKLPIKNVLEGEPLATASPASTISRALELSMGPAMCRTRVFFSGVFYLYRPGRSKGSISYFHKTPRPRSKRLGGRSLAFLREDDVAHTTCGRSVPPAFERRKGRVGGRNITTIVLAPLALPTTTTAGCVVWCGAVHMCVCLFCCACTSAR